MRYLDPKNDLTFKKVFGEHQDLVKSLINALLPLEGDQQVDTLEYLPAELVPDTPLGKDSIVDVRCQDALGRQFIVEMQMIWTPAFQQRVLFNASKAYVRQLKRSRTFDLLQPVYSLNLLNEVFMPDLPNEFIHNYNMVHEEHSDKVIEGLHLTFVELPKFTPHTLLEKKMAVLWLKFLTEINEDTTKAPQDLLDNPEIKKALEEVEESAYTDAELDLYDRLWGRVDKERLYYADAQRRGEAEGRARGLKEGRARGLKEGRAKGLEEGRVKGLEEGRVKGLEEGRAEGLEEGRAEGLEEGRVKGLEEGRAEGRAEAEAEINRKNILNMRSKNLADEDIASLLNLDVAYVQQIR